MYTEWDSACVFTKWDSDWVLAEWDYAWVFAECDSAWVFAEWDSAWVFAEWDSAWMFSERNSAWLFAEWNSECTHIKTLCVRRWRQINQISGTVKTAKIAPQILNFVPGRLNWCKLSILIQWTLKKYTGEEVMGGIRAVTTRSSPCVWYVIFVYSFLCVVSYYLYCILVW
jgi:hypothetical protein